MMLWDIIRNFFVQYIFGGHVSNDIGYFYSGFLGSFYNSNDDYFFSGTTYDTLISFEGYNGGELSFFNYYCLGDYLSTTATIIVLTLICVAIGMAVVWLFKEIYRMITKWAF